MKLLKRIILIGLLWVGSAYADTAKVVYDLTTGNSEKIESLIAGIQSISESYKKQNNDLKVIVVISGDSYKYFVDDIKKSPYASDYKVISVQPRFKKKLQNLKDNYAVSFQMCAAGMKKRGIKKESLYSYVEAQKVKVVYLIDAQNSGYAYISVH
jgi:intracellular sulfur oxidation DsrE/DsrF family protein